MVTTVPGAPLVGEKLFRSAAATPVQNRGSLAGERKVTITEPLDSMRDSMHGAGFGIEQDCKNVPVESDLGAKQTLIPVVVGSPCTVSVTVRFSPASKR